MSDIFLVGMGGFIGSISRYFVYLLMRSYFIHSFPLATLIVNVTGCFLIGMVSGLERQFLYFQRPMLIFISVGLIGGFTTFSAFGFETVELIRLQHYRWACLNIFCNLILGFGAIWVGRMVTTSLG